MQYFLSNVKIYRECENTLEQQVTYKTKTIKNVLEFQHTLHLSPRAAPDCCMTVRKCLVLVQLFHEEVVSTILEK